MKQTVQRAAALMAAAVFLAGVSGGRAAAPFAVAKAPYAFHFPADHGAHPTYQSEWWYFTGHLRAAGGRRFGYELTFFRVRLRPEDVAFAAPPQKKSRSRWRGDQIYPAHFAITDVSGRGFVHIERVARQALGLGSAAVGRLDVHSTDWSVTGAPLADRKRERIVLHAADPVGRIDIVQTPLKPPAIHGYDGLFRKGACRSCATHYYSYTRLQTRGTLTYGGQRFSVEGSSWMDHEYGTNQLEGDEIGWDWLALQLDDGRELMLEVFRRQNGEIIHESSGSLIERDGRVWPLRLSEFRLSATGHWHSEKTQTDYPSGWRVEVPSAGIDAILTPSVQDQEIVLTSGPSYWEGDVEVRDAATSRSLGQGYVELTGYVEPVVL